MKSFNESSRKEILDCPTRYWNETSVYRCLIIIPTGKKHDSGWACMYIVGEKHNGDREICATHCDDINWKNPKGLEMRTDMGYTSKSIHIWSNTAGFKVSESLSSMDIELVEMRNES